MNTARMQQIPPILTLAAALTLAGCSDRTSSTPKPPSAPAALPTAAPLPTPAPDQSSNPYLGLRDLALTNRVPANFSNRLTSDPTLHAILVDWTISKNATATLMCSADGSSSIYTSTGGGFIGSNQQAQVREAAVKLFQIAIELKDQLAPNATAALPDVKQMRFTLVTTGGLRSSIADVDELRKGGHALAALANQVQVVIAAIRAASDHKR